MKKQNRFIRAVRGSAEPFPHVPEYETTPGAHYKAADSSKEEISGTNARFFVRPLPVFLNRR